MDFADVGQAMLSAASVAGAGVVGLILLFYASHAFMVVFADSSTGIQHINWPTNEALFDWWWKPIYCLGLLGFFGAFLATFLMPMVDTNPLLCGVVLGTGVWLLYPIGLLSTHAGSEWYQVMHLGVLQALARRMDVFLTVLVMTAIPLGLAVGCIVAFFTQDFLFILPTAILAPAALLYYARGWGLAAWLVMNDPSRPQASEAEAPVKTGRLPTAADNVKLPAAAEARAARRKDAAPGDEAPAREDASGVRMKKKKRAGEDSPLEAPRADDEPRAATRKKRPAKTSEPYADEDDPRAGNKRPFDLIDMNTEINLRSEVPIDDGYGSRDDGRSGGREGLYADAASRSAARRERERLEAGSTPDPTFGLVLGERWQLFLFDSATLGVWFNLSFLTGLVLLFLFVIFAR